MKLCETYKAQVKGTSHMGAGGHWLPDFTPLSKFTLRVIHWLCPAGPDWAIKCWVKSKEKQHRAAYSRPSLLFNLMLSTLSVLNWSCTSSKCSSASARDSVEEKCTEERQWKTRGRAERQCIKRRKAQEESTAKCHKKVTDIFTI